MAEHTKFWMVWNPQGRQPRYQHMSRQAADCEASRLAQENPGEQFFVLKSMSGFTCPESPVQKIQLRDPMPDEIPF